MKKGDEKMKLAILGNACVREDTLEMKFVDMLQDYGIEKTNKL